uniref:Putative conserved plasma membrane protein n=1 Tax=Xenopsylla cheopis TaxID=163159 RepID=A0A6M2DFQ3_XENCH
MDPEIPLKGITPGLYRNPGRWRGERPLRGPLRALRLCILSALLPGLLIAVPLYMRYYVYRDQLYPLGVSDMRLIDGKVSTTWCQKQVVRSNVTFNAFLMEGVPAMSPQMHPVSMTRHLTLSDDMKEYWAFYLLKESVVTVSSCVRWPGASLVVIRGHRHLHECAFIGDDSSEEEEELIEIMSHERRKKTPSVMQQQAVFNSDEAPSNNPELMIRHHSDVVFHHENNQQNNQTLPATKIDVKDDDLHMFVNQLNSIKVYGKKKSRISSAEDNHVHKHRELSYGDKESNYITLGQRPPTPQHYEKYQKQRVETSNELMDTILNKLELMGSKGHDILKKLNEKLKLSQTTNYVNPVEATENIQDITESSTTNSIIEDKDLEEHERLKRDATIAKSKMREWLNSDDKENDAAIEKGLVPDGIADHHRILNETTLNDRSNSEYWSSFSSSEEALLNCAGLILSLPLTPSIKCEKDASHSDLDEASVINAVTYRVHSNGYYFFVFSSENEVRDNFIQVQFNINRSVYNVTNSIAECRNSTEVCSLPLKFFSDEKLVLELPLKSNDSLSNKEFIVISECEPRTAIYIVCVIAVPLVIIIFAFQ